MSVDLEETARGHVAKYLPALIERVLKSYHDFLMAERKDEEEQGKEKPSRSKEFTDYHNAGKVAISHLDVLFKLAKSIGIDTGESEKQMLTLMAQAKEDTNRFHAQEVPKQGENHS